MCLASSPSPADPEELLPPIYFGAVILQFLSRDSHASSPYLLDRARFTPDQLTDWLSRGQKQRHLMNAVHVKPTRSPRIVLAPLSHHVGISLLSCL